MENKSKQETPKALQDKSSSLDIVSKRGSDDLVESLYNEFADKTPELKRLDDMIDNLTKSKNDSTELFDNYNSKNQLYFQSANRHVEVIKDSLLRDKMKRLIALSLTTYNASILQHNNIINSIETKSLTLADLHTVLKIARTLPIIERYQSENLPITKPLEGFSKQLDEAIKYADTITKK